MLGDLLAPLFAILKTTATEVRSNQKTDRFNDEQYHVLGVDLLALPNLIFLNPETYRPPVDFADDTEDNHMVETDWTIENSNALDVLITRQGAGRHQLTLGDAPH